MKWSSRRGLGLVKWKEKIIEQRELKMELIGIWYYSILLLPLFIPSKIIGRSCFCICFGPRWRGGGSATFWTNLRPRLIVSSWRRSVKRAINEEECTMILSSKLDFFIIYENMIQLWFSYYYILLFNFHITMILPNRIQLSLDMPNRIIYDTYTCRRSPLTRLWPAVGNRIPIESWWF